MEDKLFELIIKYGKKELSFEKLKDSIREICNRTISNFIVDEYWEVVEIEDIINDLLNPKIKNQKQFETEKEIEILIKKYDARKLSLQETQKKIKTLTGVNVDQYSLDNYWRSEDLKEYVKAICIKKIEDWESMDDEKALSLISEIIKNPTSAILIRNGKALEKKHSKPTGTVSDLIFWNDYTPSEILKELKIDTVINL